MLLRKEKQPLERGCFDYCEAGAVQSDKTDDGLLLCSGRLFEYFLQAAQQFVTGVVHMPFANGNGTRFIACGDGLG